MYDYFNGKFVYKISGTKGFYAIIDVSGIGYSIEIMERDYLNLPNSGDNLKLYSVLLHKEDKMSLCGFLRREDRDIFNILTSVSGVGSKMAFTLLNSFEVADLVGFVLDANYKELTRAKGVGAKLAQKIILELKDKLTSYNGGVPVKTENSGAGVSSQNIEDARMVMLSLGYEKKEVDNALSKSLSTVSDNAGAEEILKQALKILSV